MAYADAPGGSPAARFLACHDAILRLARDMHGAARVGDWKRVALLQGDYSAHVEQLRQADDGPALTPAQHTRRLALLQDILEEDAALRALLAPAVEAARRRLDTTRRRQALVHTYAPG